MTKKEAQKQARLDEFNAATERLTAAGYVPYKRTVSILMANVLAMVCAVPLFIVFIGVWVLRWRNTAGEMFSEASNIFYIIPFGDNFALMLLSLMLGFLLLMAVFIASVVIHELLHGITWRPFCKNGWKSIRFGVMWDKLTPYCHCKEPLRFGSYMLGVVMPLLVLGIAPYIAAMFISNIWLLAFSLVSITAAGGDIIIAVLLLKHPKALIIDHPRECGFMAFEKRK